jgi:hypothetical protein
VSPTSGTRPVRFLVYIDGELADEATMEIVPEGPSEALFEFLSTLAEHHAKVCAAADARGSVYLVDVEFWDGEHVRWGTDVAGMVVPVEVGLHELSERILERWT